MCVGRLPGDGKEGGGGWCECDDDTYSDILYTTNMFSSGIPIILCPHAFLTTTITVTTFKPLPHYTEIDSVNTTKHGGCGLPGTLSPCNVIQLIVDELIPSFHLCNIFLKHFIAVPLFSWRRYRH